MDKQAQVQDLTNVLSKFTAYIGKRLPTDVTNKLGELRSKEVNFLAKEVYESMRQNQEAADKLDR
ncbi:L(+)-tartrate dehydratase subunit alpha, partial [Burkholderia pseudomallei]